MANIKELFLRRFNHVMPSVYDDAISYPELLYKMVDKTDEIVEQVNTNTEDIEANKLTADDATEGQVLTADGEGGYSWEDQTGGTAITVDSAMSSTSENPVQNKVIYTALAGKASSNIAYSESIEAVSPSGGDTVRVLGSVDLNGAGQVETCNFKDITFPDSGSDITVDSAMSSTSTNPVQNAVIYEALSGKGSKYYQYNNIYYNNETGYLVFENADGLEVFSVDLISYFASASVSRTNNVRAIINTDFDVIDRITTNSAGQVTEVRTTSIAIPSATTTTDGLMSATDKANLDAVVADYQSAITALG